MEEARKDIMTNEEGLISRVAVRVRQGICGLHGHDSLLHFDSGRISLLCSSCGHESPGWEVGNAASHARHAVVQAPALARVARVAYSDSRAA
jgi:hypothetical protein